MASGFLGEVTLFAGTYVPLNWVACEGQLLPIKGELEALFSLIGTTYGGDGRTNFAVPDLRGRVPVGVGGGSALPKVTLGEQTGNNKVVAANGQQPSSTTQPVQGLIWIICINGRYPAADDVNKDSYMGGIKLFAGNYLVDEKEIHYCEGQLLPIERHMQLFLLIGSVYGGHERGRFALPDLRGRVPTGHGQGRGLPDIKIGQKTGGVKAARTEGDEAVATQAGLGLKWIFATQGIRPEKNTSE
ncbi:MAG: tail fiber protein [Chloroflexota bacterium]